jgi:TetR/AcrR family transcriptional regulator, transcriptional repressor of aconitase
VSPSSSLHLVPKVSREHLEARREQILDGARRTFARHGYHGATVSRLEKEIGLSRGAIFNYYPDKWSLFLALVARDRYRFLDVLSQQGLDGLLRQMTEESPEWLGVYFELAHRLRTSPELLKDFEELAPEEAQQAKALFASWQRDGAFRADVELETVIQFVNLVANGIALATSIGLKFDVDALLRLVHTGSDPPE